jgi:hypothetical protein
MKTVTASALAILLASAVFAQEIGYVEQFALSTNRADALKDLVPGTDDFYYYHALHAQNTGQRAVFQETIDRWIRERNGSTTDPARELLNRQALLDYEKEPAKTLSYLRNQLNPFLGHARKTGERRSDAPTKLDGKLIAMDTLLQRALSFDRNSLERIENTGLEIVVGKPITDDQRRNLLARLQRPDYPGLADLILADLVYRDSCGFGSHPIHSRLTLAQLDDLLQKKPDLRNQTAFVNATLSKLAPEDEVDLETDAAARQAYFERVWAFVKTLEPVHNSLKANVLYGRLRHDQKMGIYDPVRFLDYVKLPRDVYYLTDEVRRALPRSDQMAQLGQSFGLLQLPPVSNEEPLVRDYLLKLFVEAPDYDAYKPWIRDDFLKRLFAEAKITAGVGEPQQWANLLSPDEFRRLKERIDIEWAPGNPDVLAAGDAVTFTAFVKNVPTLIVKVYEINTLNYYRETGQPLNLAVNLDGLVASFERRVTYSEPPERRIARTFEFPELKNRGAYVVELIGNGKSSRALVQKGRLGVLQEVTAAGHAFTVLDEANRPVADARAWLGGREFTPDAKGRLVIPFSTDPRSALLVVHQGGFASPVRFQHLAETYDLQAGLYVDRETLIRREKAVIALRPVLRVCGRPASLKLLEEPRLVIRVQDIQGITTEKEIPSLALREDAETLQEFTVPDNAVSVTVTLKAKIQNISRNQKQDLADSATFALNGIDRTAAVQALHVSRTAAGYIVELRGKNGEPRPGEPLHVWLKHRLFRDAVEADLKTDDHGRAWLGDLDGIANFRVREPFGSERTWTPAARAGTLPAELHGRAGDTLRVPVTFDAAEPLKEVSLLEQRQGQFVRDCGKALAVKDGFIEFSDLPAGDYSLYLKPLGHTITVRLTQGADRDGFTLSPRRALERPRLAPLQVTAVNASADAVEIRLANATPFTRVHVLATRYLPAYDLFGRLGFTGAPGLLQQPWTPARTFYESGRDIGDEYRYILDRQTAKKFPGNMLERPGLLLNPWAIRETEAERELLAQGGQYAGRAAGAGAAAMAYGGGGPGGSAEQEGYASLDFLKQPAVVLWNLAPGKDGVVRIPRADLKGLPHLRILAADPLASVLRNVALEDTPVATRELRQVAGLDPAKTFSEQKIITPVTAKGALAIADAATARFQACDTVAKAYRLLATLGGNPTFEEFSFVANWPSLDAKEKRKQYSKYACHELSFFLQQKDPAFFKEVIAPYLKNKKDKTFMDRWLLGDDLKDYLDTWRLARLNAVERILLGQHVAAQAASQTRDARERADLIPPNIEDFNRRFDTALQAGGLDEGGDMAEAIDGLRKSEEQKGEKALYSMVRANGNNGRVLSAKMVLPATSVVNLKEPQAEAAEAPMELGDISDEQAKDKEKLSPGEVARKQQADGKKRQYARAAAMDRGAADADGDGTPTGYFADARADRAQAQRRFFQKLDATKEWAENNYYHLPIEQQLADLVPASAFWADYAAHDGKTPFLSTHFAEATRNFTEMMLALAVLDLPFEAGKHTEALDGLSYNLTAASPLVMFHREIREAARAEEPGVVLVAQRFFRADDRYRNEGNERFEKYVAEEFLPHVVYGARVLLTNPTDNRQKLQVLLQLPMGALPVNSGFYTRGVYVTIEPHATQSLEYYFYFPATGKYAHYPVTLAQNDRVTGGAAPFTFNVVAQLTNVDKTSWPWISQNGTPEDVLAFLEKSNLWRQDLTEIAWRMKDKAYFQKVTGLLEARHIYHDTLWAYSLQHNDTAALRTWLSHSPFADRCGLHLISPLLTLDPVERLDYQHLEYAPLVNPRAHPVGAKRTILNNRLREQYQRLMTVLRYKAVPSDVDELAVTYYLALQDRVAEALDWNARVDRKSVPEQLQCDYLDVYLAFYRGDTATARRIAKRHAEDPVDRWRMRFEQALAQLDEIEKGAAAAASDPENRDQAQGALAATEPALELQVEAGKIRLDYRNLKSCALNFYPMDIELLFSRNPFLQEGAAQFAFIRPVLSRTVDLPAGKDTLTVDLPAEFKARNVMVEVVGAGLRKSQGYYANTLKVQMIEAYGQVAVTHADTRKPVPGAYVKVYAKLQSGEVKFVKDGYTDLRGRFDYASLNTSEVDNAQRLSLLILSEPYGAVVREAAPPKR